MTIEIPVHQLFRDEPEPASMPAGASVIGRRRGTGEQPRTAWRTPLAPRPVPVVDPDLAEYPARVLPGVVGALAGGAGVAGSVVAAWWAGLVPPEAVQAVGLPVLAGAEPGIPQLASLVGAAVVGLFGFAGLSRGRTERGWVLDLFGRYRGTIRRTGLMWVNPFLMRRRIDVRLRHWRSEPMAAVDANGVSLRVVVLVVWRVEDTARAVLGVEDHERYLQECVEAGLSRVLGQLPADMAGVSAAKDVEAVGDALTRIVAADAAAIGLEVFSAQPAQIEYAPEVAPGIQRRRIAALDAKYRDRFLSSVVDSVEDTVTQLTTRGLIELDEFERKALVKDLTVAFYTGHGDR